LEGGAQEREKNPNQKKIIRMASIRDYANRKSGLVGTMKKIAVAGTILSCCLDIRGNWFFSLPWSLKYWVENFHSMFF
jgi:hypothetical protein